jgi:hypothetical protein
MDVKKEVSRASSFHRAQFFGCSALFSGYEMCLTEVTKSNQSAQKASHRAVAEHCTFPYMRYLSCVDSVAKVDDIRILEEQEQSLKY